MLDSNSQIPCRQCPLRLQPLFSKASAEEIGFIENFKIGELHGKAAGSIYLEGADSPHLFTLLAGWAFRYKTLQDGRRQILNYILPGDFIGMQIMMSSAIDHGVEALTDVRLCVFSKARMDELFTNQPGLARDITWLAAREERILDDHLLALGRRKSRERIAYLLLHLVQRAEDSGLVKPGGTLQLPMTQQHLADTLGLSLVTFNKTLQRLRKTNAFTFSGRLLQVKDSKAMIGLAATDDSRPQRRPLI